MSDPATEQITETDPEKARIGDWLVVPSPPTQHQWRWGRITGSERAGGRFYLLVRWLGDDEDSIVLPPSDARIEPAQRWPHPGGDAIGVWTT
ncbi:DUF1918 domain-containing protein [Pseudonocardia sp. GCM10023141]|uniref:DUF1918 domain-containing protein n=1 Tax=Pseudonocardia sp. GCM10023141 TaxID=3252653 RepID=UPI00361AA7C7